MPAKSYCSQLFPASILKETGIHIIYSAMGSGKTSLIKSLILEVTRQCLLIAPYRSCRIDFRFEYPIIKDFQLGSQTKFLYTSQVWEWFLQTREEGQEMSIQAQIDSWIQRYFQPKKPFIIILDEVDFMWTQANMEFTQDQQKITDLWEQILQRLARHFPVLGFTSTKLPDWATIQYSEYYLTQAATSVYFSRVKTLIIPNNIKRITDFLFVLKELAQKRMPTLIYKWKYTAKEIQGIITLAQEKDLKILIILRPENAAMKQQAGYFAKAILETVEGISNIMDIREGKIDLAVTKVHYLLIGAEDDSLDKANAGTDVFNYYDFVFINTSSSRQVSIPKKNGGATVRVCTFNNDKVTATAHQVCGRFRFNPVEVLHVIAGYKRDLEQYNLAYYQKLDPCFAQYIDDKTVWEAEYKNPMSKQDRRRKEAQRRRDLCKLWLRRYAIRWDNRNQIYSHYKQEVDNPVGKTVFYNCYKQLFPYGHKPLNLSNN